MRAENILSNACPELLSEWSDRNEVTPDGITYGSNKQVWWRGKCGHEWQASPKARHSGENCPYCAGKRILQGYNDLATTNPELAEEWADKKTGITEVTAGSHKKVWWKGKCGHRWQAVIKNRAGGSGCPYCSGNLLLKGYNDLATTNPDVAAEWSDRNLPLLPTMVMANTNRKAWWRCEKGHEWNTLIPTRTGGSKCPFCSGIRILKGFNDLATTNPELAEEWSDRNRKKPFEINALSRDNVWWICHECGNEWQAVVDTRVHGSGCPVCTKRRNAETRKKHLQEKENRTIFEESYEKNVVLYYLSENRIEVQTDTDGLIGIPIAFYFPKINVAMEITGYGDRQTKRDRRFAIVENDLCRKRGINLIRILPRGAKGYDDCICLKQNGNHKRAFGEALCKAFKKMGRTADIDVVRDSDRIYQYYLSNYVSACGQVDHKQH